LADYKDLYRLGTAYKKGGFAEVFFQATRRSDGARVALKRPRGVPQAAERLRREIEVQIELAHPNIMPIWDADPDRRWFVMPPADGNLMDLCAGIDEEEFASLLVGAADALAVAHEKGYIHRDLTPPNILAMPAEGGGRRWVIADWGLVTRPYAAGSIPLTKAGTPMGTDPFAAPEVLADGRSATPVADVYSLGRIAQWYLTGRIPVVSVQVLPDDDKIHWRTFVRECTEPDPGRRADLATFRSLLDQVFTLQPEPAPERAREMVSEIIRGQLGSLGDLFRLAADHPQNAAIYLDEVARLPSSAVREWIRRDPEGAARAGRRMCEHLTSDTSWAGRDAQWAGMPLSFVQEILMELAARDMPGLVDDVALDFFRADMRWDGPSQRMRVREWLSGLDGRCATVIARILTRYPDIADYYRPLRPRHVGLASLLTGRPVAPPQ